MDNDAAEPTAPVSPGEVREVGPGVFLIANPVPFPPGFQNAYLLADAGAGGEKVWTLVDPGLPASLSHVEKRLAETFADGPEAGRRIARVIATHHHPDHIGGAAALVARGGAELLTTRTAFLYARMMQLDASPEPKPEAEGFLRRAGFDEAMLERWRERQRSFFALRSEPLPLGFTRLAEGDALRIGGRAWRVLIGQGHAPDHILLHAEEDGLLLAGDQILPRISPNISVYPLEPDADPLGDWLASCEALAERFEAAPQTLALPGHGEPFRDPGRRLRTIIAKHQAALQRLAEKLDAPKTVVECFPALFRRGIPEGHEGLAAGETLSHLHRLLAEGRVERRLRTDGVHIFHRA